MSYEENFGVPTMVLLPARNHHFKVAMTQHIITIPRSGFYNELAPDFFDHKDGEFLVLDEEGVLYMPAVIKVLFASAKYPDLKDNELFAVNAFIFKETTVDVIGQVMEILPPMEKTDPSKVN